ncbi:hypothetical protein ZOSMA_55G00140 [Zostera marina]|uniref:C2 NT-type domain-containing protein n=1 Tax=Zostera marina TaxID=29655 RepID=A0A0K9NYE3_ZOSMR|nr:hypothetical protein ZOSMA_55G00140 [Zostera marina]
MFKARWRSDRNKIKAVFRLQFNATQIPQPGWESLVVSLIPLDGGKTMTKSEKAVVVDGACCWDKALFETVRLSKEPKTGKINEKNYRFLVSATESTKARILGEASVDFANYAEAVKPSIVWLPLKASNSNPILHFTIQLMQDDADQRESEKNEITRQRILQTQLNNHRNDSNNANEVNGNLSSAETFNQDNIQIKSRAQSILPSNGVESLRIASNQSLDKSGSFDSLSMAESDYGSEQNTPKEDGLKIHNTSKDPNNFSSHFANNGCSPKETISPNLVTLYGDLQRSATECSIISAPDGSSDGSANSLEDTKLREKLEGRDFSSEKHRNEVVALVRQIDVSDLELQALRKQIVKERRHREDISKELCTIRDEKDALKRKCELLKASEFSVGIENSNNLSSNGEDLRPLLEDLKQELSLEKNLNVSLHLQIQKTQESNTELILAVRDLEEMLEQKNEEIPCSHCNQLSVTTEADDVFLQTKGVIDVVSIHKRESSKEISETVSECEENDELEVLAREKDNIQVEYSLEQKIMDLNEEIEFYKKDHDSIEMQMEQLALDFEIIKQENHDLSSKLEQSQLREQLKTQYECSAHTSIISDLEDLVENLENDLKQETEMFEADLVSVMNSKIEQEQRAISAEEKLRQSRLNNRIIVERLQEEFKRLAILMSTAFSANEKLTKKALAEASELNVQKIHLQESLGKANENLVSIKHQHKIQLHELLRQIELKIDDANEMQLKLKTKYEELENQKKSEDTLRKVLSEEIAMVKSAAKILSQENSKISDQLMQKQTLMDKMEEDKSREKDLLDEQLASVKNKTDEAMVELCNLRNLKDENEKVISSLNSDIEILRTKCSDLKASKELVILQEKNKFLEDEVKLKDAAMKVLKHSLIMNEKNFNSRTEEVENYVTEHNQNHFQRCEESMNADDITRNTYLFQEDNSRKRSLQSEMKKNTSICDGVITDNDLTIIGTSSNQTIETPLASNSNAKTAKDELIQEVDLLKEKNELMEVELKEMQERYLEISLKFAEVEGERQQHIMTIRTLKNAKKK